MNRRGFLTGLAAALAAPAIVQAGSLMPVRGIIMPLRPASSEIGYHYLYVLYPMTEFRQILAGRA